MKVLIIGATGQVGQALATGALEQGHDVSVLVRSPHKLSTAFKDRIKVFPMSSLEDELSVEKALEGQEVVLSAIGPALFFHPSSTPIARGIEALMRKMREARIRRFILQSTVSDGDAEDRFSPISWLLVMLVWTFAHHAWRDIIEMGKAVRREVESPEWIIVRVAALTNSEGGKVGEGMVGSRGARYHLARKDIARFMLDNLNEPRWVGKMPYIWST